MLELIFEGRACILASAWPEGTVEARLSTAATRDVDAGGRAARRAIADAMRVERLVWTSVASGEEAARWRAIIATWTREAGGALRGALRPVLAPWWPGLTEAGAASPWAASGLHALVSADLTVWVVGTPAAPASLAGGAWWVPLVVAQFRADPVLVPLADDSAEWRIEVEEIGEARHALSLSAQAPEGPVWRGQPRPLWCGGFEGGEKQVLDVAVSRRRLGAARVPVHTYVPHVSARGRRLEHACAAGEAVELLATWWRARAVEPCWVPAGYAVGRLLAPIAAGATAVTVSEPAAVAGQAHVALVSPDGRTGWLRTTGAPSGSVVPVQAVQGDWSSEVSLQPLLLAVLGGAVEVRWFCPGGPVEIGTDAREEPEDYVAVDPAGELYGVTFGPLAPRAWLYALTDGVTTWRYTSWDRDLVRAGHTWSARTITHSDLREGLDLGESELTLQVDAEEGHPLLLHWLDRLAPTLSLQVWTTSVASPDTPHLRWSGQVRSVRPRGRVLEARAGAWSTVLARRIPAAMVQPTCWKTVYGAACGLAIAQWVFAAELVDAESPGEPWAYRFGSLSWRAGAALPAMPAHWWAGGRAERSLPGGRRQIAAIVDSEAYAAGTVRLFLSGDLHPWPLGLPETGWQLVRGCSGTWEDCGTLGNRPRYGGLPHLPKGNPSFVRLDDTPPALGKK